MKEDRFKVLIQDLSVYYNDKLTVTNINLNIPAEHVVSLIGPSGCGKSTLLRCINRLNDTVQNCRIKGNIFIDNNNIYDPSADPLQLRRRVGMVFQKPVVFPFSIFENVAYGLRLHKLYKSKKDLEETVLSSLDKVGLLSEVQDRLHDYAERLSGGQQQRLCIARALAINPDIILMDEPCSALDPIATAKIESLIERLKKYYTIIIVTHSMQQAARVSDYTAFLYMGELVEFGLTKNIFTNPQKRQTEDYISGRFG